MRSFFFRSLVLQMLFAAAVCFGGTDAAEDAAKEYSEFFEIKSMTPGYSGKFLWGMFTDRVKLKDLTQIKADLSAYPPDHTAEVIRYITPGGIGEAEQLKSGDVILETGSYSSATSRPGEKVSMTVWRKDVGVLEKITATLPQYYQIKSEPYTKPDGAAEFEKTLPPDWDVYVNFLKQSPVKEHLDDLRQRLTDIDSLTDAYRLPIFRYLIRSPFRIEQVSRGWKDKISEAKDLREMLMLGKYMLDFAPVRQGNNENTAKALQYPDGSASVEEIAAFYLRVLERCSQLHRQAFARITPQEMRFVREHRHDALESICKYHMLSYEPNTESARNTLQVFEILNRIDQKALFEQAETALLFSDQLLLARLQELLAGKTGELYRLDSSFGPIVIVGCGDDYHTQDAAVIIDLGGNDIYLNNQAAPVGENICTAVIIDRSGDDYYSTTDASGQACGDLGTGILIDMDGDDTYVGIEMVQASAFGGIGILCDYRGNDSYRAVRMSQAAAFFGTGMLIDHDGNDNYSLQHFGQALGSTRGVGVLLDGGGDDNYICKGNVQTSYGTRGHFDGWGQGIGFGVRPFASGGIGILLDKSGTDRYDGGTFTQGGGYYYSYGICCDQGDDDDFYFGTRYSNGFAAHQALGVFIEEGGDDVYRTQFGVSLGISWDETVVLFADDEGDDIYDAGWLSHAYSSVHHNGICFFFDREGDDRYIGTRPMSGNSYHGGHSLGIFVDSGSGEDQYRSWKNNSSIVEEGDNIVIDL